MNVFQIPQSLYEDDSYFKDPGYRTGCLSNGLTYYIRHNEEPRNCCNMEIVHRVGSMQEEDHERGLAHLLEHLGFSKLKHSPSQNLRDYLKQFGIKGADKLNACTAKNYTRYYIHNIPTDKDFSIIENALNVLSDWSRGMILHDSDIDSERGIVKAEFIRGKSPVVRMFDSIADIVTQNHRSAYRRPIGSLDVIENCPNQAVRDFYNKWYHPANQAVVIVGDVDVDKMEQMVRDVFGVLETPADHLPVRYFPMPDNDEHIFACASDKEITDSMLFFVQKFHNPFIGYPSVAQYRYVDMLLSVIKSMMIIRLYYMSMDKDSIIMKTDCSVAPFESSFNMHQFEIQCNVISGHEEEGYRKMLGLIMEIRRNGFSDEDFQMAKKSLLQGAEKSYNERDHIGSKAHCDVFFNSFLRNIPIVSSESRFQFWRKMLDAVSLDTLNELFRCIIDDSGKNVISIIYTQYSEVPHQAMYPEFFRSIAADVYSLSPVSSNALGGSPQLIDNLPLPGRIVDDVYIEQVDCHKITLQNGVRVFYKKTDFKNDELEVYIKSDCGTSRFDTSEFHNFWVLDDVLSSVGLGPLSEVQYFKYFNGRNFSLDYDSYEYTQILQGHGSIHDIESLMEIVYSTFTNVGSNADDFQVYLRRKKACIDDRLRNPKWALSLRRDKLALLDNSRSHYLTLSELSRLDLSRIVEMHRSIFADASRFTFYFAGNIQEDQFKKLLEKYIAVLPSEKNEAGVPQVRENDVYRHIYDCCSVAMENPISYVYKRYVNYGMDYTLKNNLLVSLLSSYISDMIKLRIRTQSSISYTCGCDYDLYCNHFDLSKYEMILSVSAEVQPQYALYARHIMDQELGKILSEGITGEVLNNLKIPKRDAHKRNLRKNSFWVFYIRIWDERGILMPTDYIPTLDSITVDDFNSFAREFMQTSTIQTFVVKPDGVRQESLSV